MMGDIRRIAVWPSGGRECASCRFGVERRRGKAAACGQPQSFGQTGSRIDPLTASGHNVRLAGENYVVIEQWMNSPSISQPDHLHAEIPACPFTSSEHFDLETQNMHGNLALQRQRCAERMLRLYKEANAGHIGSSLSCLEILVDLCFGRMAPEDILVLSKGHAAGALYTTLSLSGRMPEAGLESFYQDGTVLAAHPSCSGAIRAIPFGTGSLGHGLGLACGLAFSQRFTGHRFKVFAVLSDGDCNEGSTWEAALFAAHHRLANLTVILDLNGIQGFGLAKEVLNLEPVADKWRAFGFSVSVADDGNSFSSLAQAYEQGGDDVSPRCIMARTVKGNGVSYMRNQVDWHYLPMTDAQFEQALAETRAAIRA